MGRATQASRCDAAERWPALADSLSAALHGDDSRSVQDDVDAAIATAPTDHRARLVSEWWDWNVNTARTHDVRFAIEAFDSGLAFDTADHARAFMNDVYDRLIGSVRRDLGQNWKPEPLGAEVTS